MGDLSVTFEPHNRRLQHTLLRWLQRYERKFDHATWRFVVLAWIGCLGMPGYYLIWSHVFPQQYESLPLRLAGAALCLPAPWAHRLYSRRWRAVRSWPRR